jgi:hypothetical protein
MQVALAEMAQIVRLVLELVLPVLEQQEAPQVAQVVMDATGLVVLIHQEGEVVEMVAVVQQVLREQQVEQVQFQGDIGFPVRKGEQEVPEQMVQAVAVVVVVVPLLEVFVILAPVVAVVVVVVVVVQVLVVPVAMVAVAVTEFSYGIMEQVA